MVEQQLAHPSAEYDSGPRTARVAKPNVPKSFEISAENIVVAYGEATPLDYQQGMPWQQFNQMKKQNAKLPPVYWVAQRLEPNGSNELFSEMILPSQPVSQTNLQHLKISNSDFDHAVSVNLFRERWSKFLRLDDLLIVPNKQTIKLLHQAGATIGKHECLKAINFDPQSASSGIGEFLSSMSWPVDPPRLKGRAGKRLANAVALSKYLKSTLHQNAGFSR
jgi:hypothetical protein